MTPFDPSATVKERLAALKDHLQAMAQDDRAILVGPWRSELGFEATYWTPFIAWLAKQVPKFKDRAWVLTRGGLAPLYANQCKGGLDLYTLRSVREVRRENLYDQRNSGLQKQLKPTAWDDAVLAQAADAMNIGHAYHVLHPAWMYWLLAPYWDGTVGSTHLHQLTDFARLPAVTVDGMDLPERFVAMRFYARATFPYPNMEVMKFVQELVSGIASRLPVVLLNSPESHDDHRDVQIEGDHIMSLPNELRADQHLAVHAAVLSKATAFVGTYGGVAQLALRLGVPSISFYHQWGGTSAMHLYANDFVAKVQGVPFLVSSLSDAQLWKQTLEGLTVPAPMASNLVPA